MQVRDALSCDDLSPTLCDDVYQGVGHLLAATDKTVLSTDVKDVDQGVDIRWCMTFHTAVHGVHIGQHVAQSFVLDIVGYQVGGRPKELVAVCEEVILARSQVEEVHLVSQLVKCVDIPFDVVGLIGELLCEVRGERLASLRYAIGVFA